MTAGEFLAECLRERGYDGLALPEDACGCYLDDLEPCGAINLLHCKPGYKQTCAGCGDSLLTVERDPGPVSCAVCGEEVEE